MNDLKIIGEQVLNNIEMKIIEGGFGENQKCMLVSDIAMQHEVEIKYINKVINNNISRFGENDLIDLKTGSSKELVLNMGFTNAQYGNARNIFLLSERGYTKLVAMMDNTNEKKWEVMDKLIGGYFQMRAERKIYTNEEIMMYQLQEQKKIKEQLVVISEKTLKNENEINSLPLLSVDSKELKNWVSRKDIEVLGGNKETLAYKELSKKVFSNIYRELWRQFDVTTCAAIKRKNLDVVKRIVKEYKLPYFLETQINKLNNQMGMVM